jgi:hypothetical protein
MQGNKAENQGRRGERTAVSPEAAAKRKHGSLRPDLARGFEEDERLQAHLAKKLKLRKVSCSIAYTASKTGKGQTPFKTHSLYKLLLVSTYIFESRMFKPAPCHLVRLEIQLFRASPKQHTGGLTPSRMEAALNVVSKDMLGGLRQKIENYCSLANYESLGSRFFGKEGRGVSFFLPLSPTVNKLKRLNNLCRYGGLVALIGSHDVAVICQRTHSSI